jgi:hypothetical protein
MDKKEFRVPADMLPEPMLLVSIDGVIEAVNRSFATVSCTELLFAFGYRSRFAFFMSPVRSPLPPPDLITVEVRRQRARGRVEVNLVFNLMRSDVATAARAGSVAALAAIGLVGGSAG